MSLRALGAAVVAFYTVAGAFFWREGLHEQAAACVIAIPFVLVLALKP